eukprot:3205696-Prymnesium_polylepis.2
MQHAASPPLPWRPAWKVALRPSRGSRWCATLRRCATRHDTPGQPAAEAGAACTQTASTLRCSQLRFDQPKVSHRRWVPAPTQNRRSSWRQAQPMCRGRSGAWTALPRACRASLHLTCRS